MINKVLLWIFGFPFITFLFFASRNKIVHNWDRLKDNYLYDPSSFSSTEGNIIKADLYLD
jgi:hypothetical protein